MNNNFSDILCIKAYLLLFCQSPHVSVLLMSSVTNKLQKIFTNQQFMLYFTFWTKKLKKIRWILHFFHPWNPLPKSNKETSLRYLADCIIQLRILLFQGLNFLMEWGKMWMRLCTSSWWDVWCTNLRSRGLIWCIFVVYLLSRFYVKPKGRAYAGNKRELWGIYKTQWSLVYFMRESI